MKPIESLANHLLQGDCVELLKEFPEKSVDLVVTDPPYLAKYHDRNGRTLENDIQGDWLEPAFQEIGRVLKDNRFCVSFYGWHKVDLFMAAWKKAGLYPVGHFIFIKRYDSAQRFVRYRHEAAYLLAKGHPQPEARPLPDVLRWKYTGNKLHPTEKPVMAIEPLIRHFSRPGDLVLDPFVGSGSILLAAQKLGRKIVGIELSPDYFAKAVERLKVERAA